MEKPRWMMTNSSGKKSISFTLALVASLIVFFKFVFSGIHLKISGLDLSFAEINPALLAAFISPFLALYFGRRKDMKAEESESSVVGVENKEE
jgi:hypothetical protein